MKINRFRLYIYSGINKNIAFMIEKSIIFKQYFPFLYYLCLNLLNNKVDSRQLIIMS